MWNYLWVHNVSYGSLIKGRCLVKLSYYNTKKDLCIFSSIINYLQQLQKKDGAINKNVD